MTTATMTHEDPKPLADRLSLANAQLDAARGALEAEAARMADEPTENRRQAFLQVRDEVACLEAMVEQLEYRLGHASVADARERWAAAVASYRECDQEAAEAGSELRDEEEAGQLTLRAGGRWNGPRPTLKYRYDLAIEAREQARAAATALRNELTEAGLAHLFATDRDWLNIPERGTLN